VVDAWRVYPRLFLTWYACIVSYLVMWYTKIPTPSSEQTMMIGGVVALCVPLTKWYMENGRDWTTSSSPSDSES
jgi:nitric oxide synthase oxygenase domain/subunit